jgi:predicted outer membrane repeat protein
MKKRFLFFILFTFTNFFTFAQKHVDLYRSGSFFKSYSTIDSAIKAAYSFGDSLVLSAHTFYESNLDAQTKIIQYQGTISGTDTTTIDAAGKFETILAAGRSGSIRDIILQNSTLRPLYIKAGLPADTFRIGGNTILRNNTNGSYLTIDGAPNALILMDNTKIINNTAERIIRTLNLLIKDNVLISNNHLVAHPGILDRGVVEPPTNSLHISGKVKIINNTSDSTITAGIRITSQSGAFSLFIGDSVQISGNKVLAVGKGKGGAISFVTNPGLTTGGLKSFKMGAAIFEGNEADEGGAIYCEDSSIKLEFNGTIFRGNKAGKGGAIYTNGSLDIKNANFYDNIADTANSIYIHSKMGGTTPPNINVENTRFYNPSKPANKQNHIYARYSPSTAIAPVITFNSNWWGKSDTIGVLRESPKGLVTLGYWAVANWSIKNGLPVVKADTTFLVAAAIKYNHGLAFPVNSFAMLKGSFTVDTGTFMPTVANINSSNTVSSTYKTFKDTSSKSATADIVAWIDADTFRGSVVVWSIDTLVSTGLVQNKTIVQVLVYPNPAKDLLNIQGVEMGSIIQLYDLMGKQVLGFTAAQSGNSFGFTPSGNAMLVMKPEKAVLSIGHLANGNYLLKITNKKGQVGIAKLTKE